MRALKQRFMHDPAKGIYGDCHRAAIASIFELDLDEVPHFWHDGCPGAEFNRRVEEFLAGRGLTSVSVPYTGTLGEVLASMAALCSGTAYILGGTSRTGVNHTVIGVGGRIVHDPSRVNSGIVGPCDDGYFWITYFVVRCPEKWVLPARRPRRSLLSFLFRGARAPSPMANVFGSSW